MNVTRTGQDSRLDGQFDRCPHGKTVVTPPDPQAGQVGGQHLDGTNCAGQPR